MGSWGGDGGGNLQGGRCRQRPLRGARLGGAQGLLVGSVLGGRPRAGASASACILNSQAAGEGHTLVMAEKERRGERGTKGEEKVGERGRREERRGKDSRIRVWRERKEKDRGRRDGDGGSREEEEEEVGERKGKGRSKNNNKRGK